MSGKNRASDADTKGKEFLKFVCNNMRAVRDGCLFIVKGNNLWQN